MSYFPKPQANKNKIEVELDLSNYAPKSHLKTQQLSIYRNFLKNDLVSLKSEVDKLDIDEVKKVPRGLNSLKRKQIRR